MRHIQLLAVAAVALTAGQAAVAGSTRYECAFDVGHRRDGNWVPQVLVLQHDDGSPTALVFDTIIQDAVGKPIEGWMGEGSSVRTTFGWDVDTESGTRQSVRMSFSLTHYSNGRPTKIVARPAGYDNQFSGEGTCKLSRG